MCGICGIYEYRAGAPASVAVPAFAGTVLRDMLVSIRHRGPDDDGVYLDGSRDLALGMRRLSIIDLASGQQPIFNEDGSIVIVFNGEIYNYPELTERLRKRDHRFTTASDTEVIVHLYEDLGDACVHELRGMFAFAIWDRRRCRLFIARDRLGIKPLYFSDDGGRFIFGSEIKAILQHPSVQARLDLDALSNFLSLKYVPAPQTMFEGIQALPPGYTLVCDANGVRTQPYWDLSFTAQRKLNGSNSHLREEEYAEQLAELLHDAVHSHLISDVPFGAFLSGGLDSSTVVALMSQFLNEPVKTFSVGFEGDGAEFSELPYARMVAQHYQTDHHEVLIRPQDFINLAEKVVWHLDQPIADDACLANYRVAELASQHVKMVLTGEGGDELFAGYARYAGERLSPFFQPMPAAAKSMALAASKRMPGMRRAKLALFALCQPDELSRFVNWFPLFNHEMKAQLLSDEVRRALNGSSASTNRVFAKQLARTDARDPLSRMLYVDTKLWLPDDLLARGDKTSMAASLEARVPLLDHKLVEFVASLPSHLKLNGLTRKYLLRRVSRNWLPEPIITRKKKGFPIPFSVWFRGDAREFVHEVLSPETVRRRGLFNPTFVATLLDEHQSGFADHSSLIWGLLNVELWHRLFIDNSTRTIGTIYNAFRSGR